MDKYSDLELSILSCILQKPELIKNNRLDDKYFIKHKKIWLFMKSFYKKFNNFDLTLMMAVSKNKHRMIEYIIWLIDKEPTTKMFDLYIDELIEEYKELEQNKYIREKIYELATDLYLKNIDVKDFKKRCNEIYDNAKEIYKI